jgi:hypothetical protein
VLDGTILIRRPKPRRLARFWFLGADGVIESGFSARRFTRPRSPAAGKRCRLAMRGHSVTHPGRCVMPAGFWLTQWARVALFHCGHHGPAASALLEELDRSELPRHARARSPQARPSAAPRDCAQGARSAPLRRAGDPMGATEVDASGLRSLSRDSRSEANAQLRTAQAEIARAASDMTGAMRTMTSVLPALVERAVVAAQFEDIASQALAQAARRLRNVESLVDGLASLTEAVLDQLAPAGERPDDPARARICLERALVQAREVRELCATPSAGAGSVELF